MRQLKVDFVSLPESRINNSNAYVRTNLKYTLEKHYPGSHLNISNTPGFGDECMLQYGGVMAISTGKLNGNFAGMGSDIAGRYNWMLFKGKEKSLKVYTIYRVNNNTPSGAGDSTAWTLQKL